MSTDHPKVLLFITDQHRHDLISCASDREVLHDSDSAPKDAVGDRTTRISRRQLYVYLWSKFSRLATRGSRRFKRCFLHAKFPYVHKPFNLSEVNVDYGSAFHGAEGKEPFPNINSLFFETGHGGKLINTLTHKHCGI